ncbi:MAG: hypothetical protein ACPGVO_03805 [Spirulinaceae cyanobacterium]
MNNSEPSSPQPEPLEETTKSPLPSLLAVVVKTLVEHQRATLPSPPPPSRPLE